MSSEMIIFLIGTLIVVGIASIPIRIQLKRKRMWLELKKNPPPPIIGTVLNGSVTGEGSSFTVRVRLPDGSEHVCSTKEDAWRASKELEIGSKVRLLQHPTTKKVFLADYEYCWSSTII